MEAEGVPIEKLAELSESNAVMLIKALLPPTLGLGSRV